MKHRIIAFIVTPTKKSKKGKEISPIISAKSAPHYFEKTVPTQFILNEKEVSIDNLPVKLVTKIYYPDFLLIEAICEIDDIFADNILGYKDKLHALCYEIASKNGGMTDIAEEYSIYQTYDYKGDPETIFLKGNEEKIANLLKSEKIDLDSKEIEYTLGSKFKYGKSDLVIVDWDGAFVFDPSGEFDETIELLEIGNYQMMRYRALAHKLDERMGKVNKLLEPAKARSQFSLWPTQEVSGEFKEIIRVRSESISQFESLEGEITLIGDWYSARLYSMISKKFRLEGWRHIVKEKLESLEDIYSIASENLGMSKVQRLELVQIWAFFILQIGWLVLIILEFIYFTRK
jgi:hypothetical protein